MYIKTLIKKIIIILINIIFFTYKLKFIFKSPHPSTLNTLTMKTSPSSQIISQLHEIKSKLNIYNLKSNIHTFLMENSYYKKLEKTKPLSFSLSKQYHLPSSSSSLLPSRASDPKEQFTSFSWAGSGTPFSNRMVACTNKGNTFIYNTDTGHPISHFVFDGRILSSCAIEPTESQLIAVGGFDGAISIKSIYTIDHLLKNDNISKQLPGHLGCISAIRFMNSSFMLTASYDSIIYLWDIYAQGRIVKTYGEHTGEVSGLDVNEVNGNIFATGSGDTSVRLWDIREKKANVATFQGSDSRVNCVKFLPGRLSTLGAGSEDGRLCLYDLRAYHHLGVFKKEKEDKCAINSIGFSRSGCILFASSNDCNVVTFWKLFGKERPFCTYVHKESGRDAKGRNGLKGTSISADGEKIGFIYKGEIVVVK